MALRNYVRDWYDLPQNRRLYWLDNRVEAIQVQHFIPPLQTFKPIWLKPAEALRYLYLTTPSSDLVVRWNDGTETFAKSWADAKNRPVSITTFQRTPLLVQGGFKGVEPGPGVDCSYGDGVWHCQFGPWDFKTGQVQQSKPETRGEAR